MKYINSFIIACLSSLLFVTTSCNFLDQEPDDMITEEMVFNDPVKVNGWLAAIYDVLPDPVYGWGQSYGYNTLVDDVQIPLVWSNYGWWSASANQGNWSASSSTVDLWGNSYKAIRSAYKFLENVKALPSQGLTESQVAYMKLEARFLIAYFYSEMFEVYGPFPLVTSMVNSDASYEELMMQRTPMDELLAWMDAELLDLASQLPTTVDNPATNYGRATKGAALAIRAKMWLLAASPLYNGCDLYKGMKNPDGTNIFPTTTDNEKWKKAADATKDLLDLAETGVYELYKEYKDGQIDPFLSCQNVFLATGDKNKELIMINNESNYGEHDQNKMPRGSAGNGAYGATQNLVDAYFTRNGLSIDEDPEYSEAGVSTEDIYYSNTSWNLADRDGREGVIPAGTPLAFCNREPRFYTSVIWHGEWYPNSSRNVNFLYNEQDGGPSYDSPQCGYLLRKRQHPESKKNPDNYPYRHGIIYRLGEFYLNYAEALNEYYGTAQHATALKYLNAIRERAGIPQYSTSDSYTKEEMREMIRKERRIELCDEGKRYTDLRRWMLSKEVLSEPIMGCNTQATSAEEFFVRTEFMTRSFEDKNYLWPIYQDYIDKNPNLVQNYGF